MTSAQSETSARIEDEILSALESDDSADIDRVTTRECSSDRFSGVQVNVYGDYVPVRPIIDYVSSVDALGIEHFYHTTDVEEPHLGAFIAYLPEQPHPAFV